MKLICENCKNEFERKRKGHVDKTFCCYECFQEYKKKTGFMRRLPDLVCSNCGKVYHPDKRRSLDRKNYHFCSKECSVEYFRKGEETRCPVCGKSFIANCNRLKYCSRECFVKSRKLYKSKAEQRIAYKERRKERNKNEIEKKKAEQLQKQAEERERLRLEKFHPCATCGTITDRPRYCCDECAKKAENRKREIKRRKRISENGKVDYNFSLLDLIERDNNICQICGEQCNINDFETKGGTFIAGNMYPSIDHIIPISHGGVHQLSNVQLAHRICNSMKSDKSIYKEKEGQICFDI